MMSPDVRPLVAVSSCLLGEAVRYDGSDKRDPLLTDILSRQLRWKPVCPEVAIGLGVPRAPIHLVEIDGVTHAVGVDDPSLDVSRDLVACARDLLDALAGVGGYIFKSRSPSCGLVDTPVSDTHGAVVRTGSGLFAAAVRGQLAELPVIDERQLADVQRRERFLRAVRKRWQSLGEGVGST